MAVTGIQGVLGAVTGGTAIVNAVLVTLQKVNYDVQDQNDVNFLFAYREEDSIDFSSDITDHFTEDNTAVQDQISKRPVKATLHGFIGELSDQKTGLLDQINRAATQLTVLAPYVPQLTVAALAAYQQASQIYATVGSAAGTIIQAYDMLVGNDHQTKQQKAYAFFKDRWNNRELFTVQTPWAILRDMAIESVRAVQEGESNMVSDFRITFKQMQFASTIQSSLTISQGRRADQAARPLSQGIQNPPTVSAPNFGGDNSTVFAQ